MDWIACLICAVHEACALGATALRLLVAYAMLLASLASSEK